MTQLNLDLNAVPMQASPLLLAPESLAHPYARYGLAVALAFHTGGKPYPNLPEEELREALARAIESGLNSFRMATVDNPQHQQELRFRPIPLDELRADASLVSGSLAARGMYLFPSIITSDKQVKGTFADVEKVLVDLRNQTVSLNQVMELKRSLAPIAGEVNNGGKEKINQKGTLFEAACTAIATVASEKPAAQLGGSNTGIFPDLDIDHLVEFIRVFRRFQAEGSDRMNGKPKKDGKYKRPPLHDGNYPNAPREAAFGAVGLLAAIGYWGSRAEETTRRQTEDVLRALKEKSIYLISYDAKKGRTSNVTQECFAHHIVELALSGNLRNILDDFYAKALLQAGMEHGQPVHFETKGGGDAKNELKALYSGYQHFYFATSQFLQRFDSASFRNFLSTRAEYPPSFDLLLTTYFDAALESHFMHEKHTPTSPAIVDAARALGQWMNYTAYRAAEAELPSLTREERAKLSKEERSKRNQTIRKAKAKNLIQFESYVMGARTPADMLHRVNRTTSLLSEQDAPDLARPFMDATATEQIPLKTAQQLLLAYLRLRDTRTQEPNMNGIGELPEGAAADDDSELAE